MWKHSPGLRTLDNKDGNWMYMEEDWTLPLKEEKEKVYIETLKGCVLELQNDNQVLLQNLSGSSGELIKEQLCKKKHLNLLALIVPSSFRFITTLEIK